MSSGDKRASVNNDVTGAYIVTMLHVVGVVRSQSYDSLGSDLAYRSRHGSCCTYTCDYRRTYNEHHRERLSLYRRGTAYSNVVSC